MIDIVTDVTAKREPLIRCEEHGDDNCPRVNGGVITHSHSKGDPKLFYCSLSCMIEECADTRHCPQCYFRNVETTDPAIQGPDTNKATCMAIGVTGKACGWKGIAEDLLKKPLSL